MDFIHLWARAWTMSRPTTPEPTTSKHPISFDDELKSITEFVNDEYAYRRILDKLQRKWAFRKSLWFNMNARKVSFYHLENFIILTGNEHKLEDTSDDYYRLERDQQLEYIIEKQLWNKERILLDLQWLQSEKSDEKWRTNYKIDLEIPENKHFGEVYWWFNWTPRTSENNSDNESDD